MNTETQESHPELGQLICKDEQKHLSPLMVAVGSVLIGAGLAFGMHLYGFALFGSIVLASGIGGLGLVLAAMSKLRGEDGRRALFLYENGVVLEAAAKEKVIPFDQLGVFQYQRTSVYYNGVYAGDAIELNLRPEFSQGKEDSIFFSASVKKENDYPFNFDSLIRMASLPISESMTGKLADEGQVEWTDKCLICKEGINAPVKSLLGSKQQLVEWSEIKSFEINDAKLWITFGESKKPTIVIDSKKDNFFPGFHLFQQLLALYQKSEMDTTATSAAASPVLG